MSDLDGSQVSNLDKAIQNAREFAGEVVAKLRSSEKLSAKNGPKVGKVA